MTQNTINALKITIHNNKHTNNTNIHFKQSKTFGVFLNFPKEFYYIATFNIFKHLLGSLPKHFPKHYFRGRTCGSEEAVCGALKALRLSARI